MTFLWPWVGQVSATPVNISIPIGVVIKQCTVPGTIALTYDDGPDSYTPDLIALLNQYQAHATFFVLGSSLEDEDNARTLELMVASGHQTNRASSYDHAHLPTLSRGMIRKKMADIEDAIRDVLDYAPTYMRPPYLETNPFVDNVMGEMAYHVIGADIDTKDYENDSPALIANSFQKFVAQLDAGGTVALLHDIQSMVGTLTRMILDELKWRGLRAVTIGECLGAPKWTWYKV
ncbi:hypothetical protein BDV59DRAFT_206452 [Aspergillus ambiguus]|uniref:uncharacterized protein n=1 Tax=Aspergillus ambiguus TaxID=176160 RepID=UPI003CCCCD62